MGRQLVDYLFAQGCEKIFCSTAFENTRSWQLIERLGFEKESHMKITIWPKGTYYDEALYGCLRTDWEE